MELDEKWFVNDVELGLSHQMLQMALQHEWKEDIAFLFPRWFALNAGKDSVVDFMAQAIPFLENGITPLLSDDMLHSMQHRENLMLAIIMSNSEKDASELVSRMETVNPDWQDDWLTPDFMAKAMRRAGHNNAGAAAFKIFDAGFIQNYPDELLDVFPEMSNLRADGELLRELVGNLPAWVLVERKTASFSVSLDGTSCSKSKTILEHLIATGQEKAVSKVLSMCKEEDVKWKDFVDESVIKSSGASAVSLFEKMKMQDRQIGKSQKRTTRTSV